MKKALVEPLGRIAQIEPFNEDPESEGIPFPVATPLRWIDVGDDVEAGVHRLTEDGTVVLIKEPPALSDCRAAKWEQVKGARDAARDAGFQFNGKLVQSDDTSRQNISGAALAAQIAKAAGAPYSVDWTCADNSVMTLTGDQVVAMFMTGAQFVQTIYARGVELREQIDTAATPEAVAAINW